MNPRNNRTGEQWDECGRCGRMRPNSELRMQKGLRVDSKCADNLDVERRQLIIAEKLGVDSTEGADTRLVDGAFDVVGEDIF